MKRFVCILLALICVFALFSCGDGDVKDIAKLVNASSPTKIITLTTHNDGEATFKGRYETIIEGNNSVLDYEYQRYQTVEEGVAAGNDEYIKTVSGTVYYADGKYSEDGVNWFTEFPDDEVMQIKLNISPKYLSKYELSKDKKTLTATVSSKNAEKMFGIAINATEDGVSVEIEHDGTYVRRISISYTEAISENDTMYVTIETSYSYGPETVVLPEAEG